MKVKQRIAKQRQRRGYRVRNRARKTGSLRLSVFRSSKHIYAQIIDDTTGRTLAAANSVESGLGGAGKNGGNVESAKRVGAAIAQRAVDAGIAQVQFDRGAYRYHGRVAALADAAREGGLKF